MIRLDLPREVPSQNVRDKWHWAKRNKDSKQWEWLIRCALIEAGFYVTPSATAKRKVRILAYRKRRITDDANLRGGAKGLVDAIVRAGLLIDDKDENVDISYAQELASKHPSRKPATVVEIEDV